MAKMVNCKACGQQIAKSAKTCPHCGAKHKKPVGCLLIVIIVLIFVFIGSAGSENTHTATEPSILNEGSTASANSSVPITEEDQVSMGEKNALRSAQNYLSVMPFSYAGLVKQLEFEGYTPEEAIYGADNCGADWNEQAARSAKNYLDIMPFSRSGLIEQLEFDGYTHEQAVYGVEQNGY